MPVHICQVSTTILWDEYDYLQKIPGMALLIGLAIPGTGYDNTGIKVQTVKQFEACLSLFHGHEECVK